MTLEILNIVGTFAIWLCVIANLVLPTYFKSKAKNLAQKQDIGDLTKIVEKIKLGNQKDIEFIKGEIQGDLSSQDNKKKVYSEFAKSLYVFNDGNKDESLKQALIDNYTLMWIWSSDDVMEAVKELMQYPKNIGEGKKVDMEDYKNAYKECILSMRKDVNKDSQIKADNFLFTKF